MLQFQRWCFTQIQFLLFLLRVYCKVPSWFETIRTNVFTSYSIPFLFGHDYSRVVISYEHWFRFIWLLRSVTSLYVWRTLLIVLIIIAVMILRDLCHTRDVQYVQYCTLSSTSRCVSPVSVFILCSPQKGIYHKDYWHQVLYASSLHAEYSGFQNDLDTLVTIKLYWSYYISKQNVKPSGFYKQMVLDLRTKFTCRHIYC